jgi:hypothetical protein
MKILVLRTLLMRFDILFFLLWWKTPNSLGTRLLSDLILLPGSERSETSESLPLP